MLPVTGGAKLMADRGQVTNKSQPIVSIKKHVNTIFCLLENLICIS